VETGSLKGVTLYVTQSTTPSIRDPEKLLLTNSGLALEYVIGTDDLLAQAIVEEMRERGIGAKKGASGALIAESDTDYGRYMHLVFSAAAKGKAGAETGVHWYLHPYSYFRGLDGKLPSDMKGGQDEAKSNGNPGAAVDSPATATSKEAIGDPQV